jgi:uncharacterized membrane protein YbhN (UPF0104 family)
MAAIRKSAVSDFVKFTKQLFVDKKEGEKKNLSTFQKVIKKARGWMVIAIGLGLFVFLITRVSLVEIVDVFTHVNIKYLLAACFVGLSATMIRALRYEYFFPASGRMLQLYGTFALMRVLYYILPFNSGELVNLGLLKKYRFSPSIAETSPIWFLIRVTDVIALTFFFSLALAFAPIKNDLYGGMRSFRWLIYGISIGLILLLLTLPFWIQKISFKISNKWGLQRLDAIKTGINKNYNPRAFIRTAGIAVIIWSFLITSYIFSQLAFNTPLNLSSCFLSSVTVYCLSLLPINTPLNIGTDEAAWTGVMVMAGINTGQAISIAFSLRVISMLVILTDGLIGTTILMLDNK